MTSWTKTLAAFRRVTTRQSDTLQRIAAREMGDASLWVDLASINGLTPPYVTTSTAEAAASGGTLHLLGTELSVPATTPQATGVTQDDVYGTDIALTQGLITASAGGDIATVSGTANLVQAIRHRIMNPLGQLVFHKTYGCKVHTLKGKGADSITSRLAALFVKRSLKADPRINDVTSAEADVTGDSIAVTCVAEAVDGKRIPVSI